MKTETKTKPTLDNGGGTKDDRMRHIVESLGPDTRRYGKTALCGEKIRDVHVKHNGEVCQACVDELRRRG